MTFGDLCIYTYGIMLAGCTGVKKAQVNISRVCWSRKCQQQKIIKKLINLLFTTPPLPPPLPPPPLPPPPLSSADGFRAEFATASVFLFFSLHTEFELIPGGFSHPYRLKEQRSTSHMGGEGGSLGRWGGRSSVLLHKVILSLFLFSLGGRGRGLLEPT